MTPPQRSLAVVAGVAASALAVALVLAGCDDAPGPAAATTSAATSTATGRPSASEEPVVGEATAQADATASAGATAPGAATAQPTASAGDSRAAVRVQITRSGWDADAHQLVVAATVPSVVEDGGTCTATARSNGVEASTDVVAVADAAGTSCGQVAFPGDRLSAGTWDVVVTYSSAASVGASEAVRVTVP